MKFEKIIIPPGWQESFTKYPNGRTIFEALSHTITTVNEGIEEVNQKVDQGLLAIEQAENIIRDEITDSFNTLKLQLESEINELSNDLISDFGLLQSQVLTLIAGKANAADVYTKSEVDAQLAEKVQNFKIKNEVVNGDFSQGDSGWLSQNSSSVASGNKLTNTANGTAVYGRVYADFNVKPLAGEKIYYRYILKPLSAEIIESSCLLRDGTGSITNTTKFTGFVVNQEKIISNLQTIPSNYLNAIRMYVSHEYPSSAVANGKSADFTKITLIRLTNIFGAGNEPTKIEMDELIKVIPNQWWDGEISLTQKQFITWQLNLIRKNTNAIIALGGTII